MRTLAALALFLLVVPTVTGEPFLQWGFDAGRTGDVPGSGPPEYEIAFETDLPGVPTGLASPLLINNSAYVLLHEAAPGATGEDPMQERDENGLFRVDLSTAELEPVVELEAPASTFISDGDRFYIAEADRLAAYALDGSGPLWTWSWPDPWGSPEARTWCGPPALDGSALYLACTQEQIDDTRVYGQPSFTLYRTPTPNVAFVARFDMNTTGQPDWVWDNAVPGPEDVPDPGDLSCYESSEFPQFALESVQTRAHRVTVLGDHALVTLSRPPDLGRHPVSTQFMLLELDAQSGEPGWVHCSNPYLTNLGLAATGEDHAPAAPAITGTRSTAYLIHDDLDAIDLETGSVTEFDDVGGAAGDATIGPQNSGSGIALADGELFIMAYGDVSRYRLTTAQIEWTQRHDGNGLGGFDPLVAGDVLYVPSYGSLAAHDSATGALQWKYTFDNTADGVLLHTTPRIAIADDVLVFVGPTGDLAVIGRTPASIVPHVSVSDLYPGVGEAVRLDLTGSEPGLGDGPLQYQADWGDGTKTGLQDDPLFEHAYAQPGLQDARFTVTNGLGQSSVETVTFDVGGSPPQDLNFLQEVFARDNQDLTFGVLGILVALTGGFVALGHRRTKRDRLQRELQAIDQAFELAGEDPVQQGAVIQERRARAKGLLADGRLEEPQYVVVERHLDDLSKRTRLGHLEQFDFLPLGIARTLQGMLSDGQISAWERERFLEGLDKEKRLTRKEKDQVRSLVDQWFERDTEVVV